MMREDKTKSTSQQNKQSKKNNWMWPAFYSGMALLFVGLIWGYNAFLKEDPAEVANVQKQDNNNPELIVETNAPEEVLKYPFSEELMDQVAILQSFYDPLAEENVRENALLVFNQTYETSTGLTISIEDSPFEVVAAKSGVVEDVILDAFQGDEIVLLHPDGMKTIYSSLSDTLVKVGDEVSQGDPLGKAAMNEWNPNAGTHLHFKVLVDDETVNPASYLGF